MEDAIASTLSYLIGVLDREYENENTYHISLITYALTLASQRPGATTEVQDAAHRAFQYLQDLAHEGGKTCCSSFNSVSLARFYQMKLSVYFFGQYRLVIGRSRVARKSTKKRLPVAGPALPHLPAPLR